MFPTQFTGASFTWERKKLGNVAENLSYGLNLPSTNYDGNNIYLRITDIDDESHTLNRDHLTSPNLGKFDKNILDYKLTENDVVFARTGASVGKTYVYTPTDGDIYFAGFLVRAKFKSSILANFVFYTTLTSKYLNYVKVTSQRSGQPGVNAKEYGNFAISITDSTEQFRIISLLKKLDGTINLHEDHLQFLHSFKSFLLQKMFFDNDIPPLLRFNKFTEKWNQCRLNDHTIVTMGQSPNSKNYTNNQTGKILVQGNADLYKNKVLKRVFTTEVTKTAVKNDILISVRAPVGDIARNQYESVVIGRGIASIKGNDFLYYQFEKMKNNGFWNKYIAGSTFESITGKDLKNTKIYTTNSDEERKIGNIFSSLTKIIQLQEHKIDSLKKLKQFLLQNMFI